MFDVESFFTSGSTISVYRDNVGVVFEEVCMFIDVLFNLFVAMDLETLWTAVTI